MNRLSVIGSQDLGAIQEVIGESQRLLADIGLGADNIGPIGNKHLCIEASDAVTRAAHNMGIVASRELHIGHFFTSFAPLDELPSEEDLILDMTWGQFNPYQFNTAGLNEFFGPREEIAKYVGKSYKKSHSAASVSCRQVVHTPSFDFRGEHRWLKTTPADVASGEYEIGEVTQEEFIEMQKRLSLPQAA